MSHFSEGAKSAKQAAEVMAAKLRSIFPCSIRATLPRDRVIILEDQDSGRLIAEAAVLPFDSVYRIPTTETNYVMLLTTGENSTSGIPILYYRNWIEPRLFSTGSPEHD